MTRISHRPLIGVLDRRALLRSGAAAALLSASGASAGPRPVRGGRMRMALSAHPHEAWTDSQPSLFLNIARHAVLEGLTEIAADSTLRPGLAEQWRTVDNGKTWAFTLRPARWHDGTGISGEHVAAALGPNTVYDGHFLVVTSDTPDPALPLKLAMPDALIAHPDNPMMGSGLYALDVFEPGRRVIARRVARHVKDGRAGWADVIDITGMMHRATRLEALERGLVDMIDHHGPVCSAGWRPDRSVKNEIYTGAHMQTGPEIGENFDNLRAAERWWLNGEVQPS